MGLFGLGKKKAASDASAIAARGAEIAAGTIKSVYGHDVKYVVEDLTFVDQATSDIAATGSIDDKHQTLAMFGFLVGEIMVRNDGAAWVGLDEDQQRLNGVSVMLRLRSGVLANPIAATIRNAQDPSTRSAVAFRSQALQLGQ